MTDRVSDGVFGQEAPSRSGGRPEYKPTPEQRAEVRRLRAADTSIGEIAKAISISRNTLRKHFAEELATAPTPIEQQLDLTGAHKVEPAQPSRQPGRPEFEPTDRQRNMVRLWAADDWTEARMALQLGIARETLRKHFADEIQFGADKVRTQVLLDLQRSSAQGKVGASNKLLERTALVAPPGPPKPPAEVEESIGKKAAARRGAQNAESGTDWDGLLN